MLISSHSWNHLQTTFTIEIWRQNYGCEYHLSEFLWSSMFEAFYLFGIIRKRTDSKMCVCVGGGEKSIRNKTENTLPNQES